MILTLLNILGIFSILFLFAGCNQDCILEDDNVNFEDEPSSKNVSASGVECVEWSYVGEGSKTELAKYKKKSGHKCEMFHRDFLPERRKLGPWCYIGNPAAPKLLDPKSESKWIWEPCYTSCGKNDGEADCYTEDELPLGLNGYLGTKNTTLFGKTCDNWGSFGEIWGNKCRAVDYWLPARKIPVCLVNGKLEDCFPICKDRKNCIRSTDGQKFKNGAKKSTTISGRKCTNWSSPEGRGLSALSEPHNLCRNPKRYPFGPYCMTEDPEVFAEPCFAFCDDDQVFCDSKKNGTSYFGTKSVSISKRPCVAWHRIQKFIPGDFGVPEMWMVSNFCRQPSGAVTRGPWCYVRDKKGKLEKEYCFDLKCDEGSEGLFGHISLAGIIFGTLGFIVGTFLLSYIAGAALVKFVGPPLTDTVHFKKQLQEHTPGKLINRKGRTEAYTPTIEEYDTYLDCLTDFNYAQMIAATLADEQISTSDLDWALELWTTFSRKKEELEDASKYEDIHI